MDTVEVMPRDLQAGPQDHLATLLHSPETQHQGESLEGACPTAAPVWEDQRLVSWPAFGQLADPAQLKPRPDEPHPSNPHLDEAPPR